MTSAAHAIADFLNKQGVASIGATTGWALAISREPENPPNVVTVYDTGGDDFDTGELDITTYSVQVRVRAVEYFDATNKINEVIRLIKRAAFTFQNLRFISVRAVGGLNHIGFDDNDRTLITTNFECLVQLEENI